MDKVTIKRAERCTTHHFGCDCWQYKYQNMEMSLESFQRKCDDLKAENEKIKSELDSLRKHRAYASEFLDATEKLGIAREALEFYAEKSNYVYDRHISFGGKNAICVHEDLDYVAREALERIK